MSRIAIVTGATQGLGLALVKGLADRLDPTDMVYLTGRNAGRVAEVMADLKPGRAQVRSEILDVADPEGAERLASALTERHGGVDIVFSNAVMRVDPDDDPAAVIDEYTQVNNFGTTRMLRAFTPRLRDGGRLIVVASSRGTLHHLAPVLHNRFTDLATLDEVDDAVRAWRDAIADGSAKSDAWPGFINIPSKVAQVAAVRTLARERRDGDTERGILIAAACPGMMDTPTSRVWFDTSDAPSPTEAAGALLDLVLDPINPGHYGELVRAGQILPWSP